MGFLKSIAGKYTKTGRRLARKERSFEKAQRHAQIAEIDSEIGFRAKEDPREQSALNQSMFGRGLGKSTIATQGKARLTDIQARRRAALLRQKDLAHRGLSLIKLRAKAARRMMPIEYIEDAGHVAAAIATGGASIPFSAMSESMPDPTGTNGLSEANWSE